jgi:hypothetical protein
LEKLRARLFVQNASRRNYEVWQQKNKVQPIRLDSRNNDRASTSKHNANADRRPQRVLSPAPLPSTPSPAKEPVPSSSNTAAHAERRPATHFEQKIQELQSQGLLIADTETWDNSAEAERLFQMEASRGMESDEEVMTEVAVIRQPRYSGKDKQHYGSRLRKPRYYNRIQTGYEWTKYNRTHYDADNLPPKIVQGYKFNIFYPDLHDKTKTPTYSIHDDPEAGPEKETVIIKFSAGPPYEDVAFRIVNQPWDMVPRFGFRCSFDHGTLQLWFKFKRRFYRR